MVDVARVKAEIASTESLLARDQKPLSRARREAKLALLRSMLPASKRRAKPARSSRKSKRARKR